MLRPLHGDALERAELDGVAAKLADTDGSKQMPPRSL